MDIGGGAEKIAWNLFRSYRARGYSTWLAVGQKFSDDRDVLLIPNRDSRGAWFRFWSRLHDRLQSIERRGGGAAWLGAWAHRLAEVDRLTGAYLGLENFQFPGTRRLLSLAGRPPDILHCHNLHGEYFDLRMLPDLSRQARLVLSLHDAWLLSGHCSHSFECGRWETGCGKCPDLSIDPAVRRDATAYNWRRKRDIYAKSRLYVATPSHWLMDRVERSMLAHGIAEARVIPNGVDLSVFHPADQRAAREMLGIPQQAHVLLFAATSLRQNRWKDYSTLRSSIALISEFGHGRDLILVGLGEDAPTEHIGQIELRFVPYQKDPEIVARYYQAADIYVHPTRVDTFPNTVLEAMACGTCVVATAVGGIPEQIEDGRTGLLVPKGDVQALAIKLEQTLAQADLRHSLSAAAVEVVRRRFDLCQQVDAYLAWYHQLAHLPAG